MDVRKVLLVKTLRELLTITVCLSCLQQQTQATDIQDEEIKMNKNLPYVESTSAKLRRILRSNKVR